MGRANILRGETGEITILARQKHRVWMTPTYRGWPLEALVGGGTWINNGRKELELRYITIG